MHTTEAERVETREERGMKIAATLRRQNGSWEVSSQSGRGAYVVDPIAKTCSCPDFQNRNVTCKHQIAVQIVIERETKPDGTVKTTKTVRMSYSQQWASYDASQMHEVERFEALLSGLCAGIEQPIQAAGRPQLPWRMLSLRSPSRPTARSPEGVPRATSAMLRRRAS